MSEDDDNEITDEELGCLVISFVFLLGMYGYALYFFLSGG